MLAEVPAERVAIHCHDTYGQAVANILTALQVIMAWSRRAVKHNPYINRLLHIITVGEEDQECTGHLAPFEPTILNLISPVRVEITMTTQLEHKCSREGLSEIVGSNPSDMVDILAARAHIRAR